MFINRAADGNNNLCGRNVTRLRKTRGLSQRALADGLQLEGLDIDKNAIQRIECGKRFVTDIELAAIRRYFGTTYDELLK